MSYHAPAVPTVMPTFKPSRQFATGGAIQAAITNVGSVIVAVVRSTVTSAPAGASRGDVGMLHIYRERTESGLRASKTV